MSTPGPLNLADADLVGFEAGVDAGRYNCVVHEVSMDATTNPDGKLPQGTPGVKFVFRATEDNENEEVHNRRFYSTYWIPPKSYDKAKASKMKGMLGRVLIALGEDEETIRSKDFQPDLEDYVGRECVVVVNKVPKKIDGEVVEGEFNNNVTGVKPAGSGVGSNSGGIL